VSVQHSQPRLRRALALGTVAAFGLGGLFAAPAFAETAPTDAPVTGSAFEDNSLELLAEAGVEAVGRDADGNVVIVASESNPAVAEFEAEYGNVVVQDITGSFSALATTDVVGGAGYASPVDAQNVAVCSTGFAGWDPEGQPAIITAGHCTDDGSLSQTFLTVPSGDTAGGGDALAPSALLGDFGFNQFGGPGNTAGVKNSTSVDIAVIDVTNGALDLLPEVTDWSTASQNDLSLSTTEISSVGTVDLKKTVSKSGRTTGKTTSTGKLTAGWANVDDRVVKGFGGLMEVGEGDSGGAVYQGEKAVGLVSGGTPDGTEIWVADLQAGLGRTGGYTVMLAIDAPKVTSPANGGEVERGAKISGTSEAGTTVVVTPTVGAPFNARSDAKGNWSFPAPTTLGDYGFSVQAKNGFNLSPSVSYAVEVVAAPLTAPVIESPADGSSVETELTEVSGTALPGAVITVTGDVTGTVTVPSSGDWSIPADLSYGEYSITVTQASEGETSPSATSDFTIAPAAPSISTPADGDWFAAGDAPEATSGVGIAGATVTVSVNGEVVGTDEIMAEPVEDAPIADADAIAAAALPGDNWEVALADSIVTGDNTISVTQTIEGVTSAAATSTIELRAVAGEAPVAGPGEDDDNGDGLAVTGGPDLMPIGIAAWLLIAGGLAAAMVVRKRRLVTED
jgi:hypothetical protein